MNCPKCGAEIADGVTYCPRCGVQINYANNNNARPVKPENYLVWAILSTILCCLPFGIVSIVYATSVDSAYIAGDYERAAKASKSARMWMLISVISCVVFVLLYLMFCAIWGVALLSESDLWM